MRQIFIHTSVQLRFFYFWFDFNQMLRLPSKKFSIWFLLPKMYHEKNFPD